MVASNQIGSYQIKVWDSVVRFFHWSLVSAFVIAYVTEEDVLTVHIWAGYLIMALITIRFIWGFIGTRYARFADFIYHPRTILVFLQDTLKLKAKRYLGHNPAGGAMVIALMLSLFMTSISGIGLLGAEEQAGPLAHWFSLSGGFWADAFEETHEFFANFTLLLIAIHVIGVLLESVIHKENLISAMLSGFKSKKINTD